MAAAVEATYNALLTVKETLALGLDNATDPTTPHTLGDHAATLSASTTPPVTKTFSDDIALVAGAGTLNLSTLAGPLSTTIDFTGLKVQVIKLVAASTNTGGITVAKGDAQPYNLFGEDNVSSETVEVLPGDAVLIVHNETTEDVGAAIKNIKFTGTGTDTLRIMLVAG